MPVSTLEDPSAPLSGFKVCLCCAAPLVTPHPTARRHTTTAGLPALLSFNKPTAQSSTYSMDGSSRVASRGVDGGSALCTAAYSAATDRAVEQWWRVDLEKVYTISHVKVYHQADCCDGQTRGSQIIVGVTSDSALGYVCGTLETDATSTPETVNCADARGRFVTVLGDNNRVRLCEVEVYGRAGSQHATPLHIASHRIASHRSSQHCPHRVGPRQASSHRTPHQHYFQGVRRKFPPPTPTWRPAPRV